jgi:polysaccharide deacetylase family sporulation protein PdaB
VAGQRRITRGAISGIEVSSALVRMPINAVVKRLQPGPGDKLVALTFDDGPWPLYTEQILDILRDEQVKATFFMVGRRVQRQPDVARRVVLEGHLIGNHSMSHKSFAAASPKEIERQIEKCRAAIKHHADIETNWVRPPYGAMDAAAWKIAKKTDSRVVRWSVDSLDWRRPGAKKIAKRVVKQVKPGAVILLHDGGGDRSQTVKALPQVIKALKAKGYIFVTVEGLYKAAAAAKKTS